MLHDTGNPYCDAASVVAEVNAAECQLSRILLAVQMLPVVTDYGVRQARGFWDTGATICLCTHAWASKMGLSGIPTPLYLKVVHHLVEEVESPPNEVI